MPDPQILLILIITAAVGFGIANGFNDAANSVATVIGTRTLSPRAAIIMAAFFEFAGAATGNAVAITIGKGIIDPEFLTMGIVLSGVMAIIIWAVVTTHYGMPISLTHGLVAGLVGAGMAMGSTKIIIWRTLARLFSAVGFAPLLGFGGGFLAMLAILWLFQKTRPSKIRSIFSKLHILSSAFLAYSHGKNDGQMPIGLIMMALVTSPYHDSGLWQHLSLLDSNTWWIIVISAGSISFGTAIGGWRVIKTLGLKVTTLRPVQGFTATVSASTVIELASYYGIPVSTTHCVSSAIMGVGATRRLSAVRWGIAKDIVLTWVFTFPACGILGWIIAYILKIFL